MRIPKPSRTVDSRFILVAVLTALVSQLVNAQDLGLGGDTAAPGSIGAALATAAPDPTVRFPAIKTAFEKFTQQQFKDAEELLKGVCEKNSELPPAGIILGTWHFNAKQAGAARAAFERAVRDNPTDPEAYVVFGDNAIRQRRFTDAALLYEKGLRAIKEYNANAERKKNLTVRALGGAAAVYETREQWKQAEAALQEVLKLDPENVVALTRRGHVLFRQDREQEAYEAFKKVYETDPEKMVRFEINMARLYQATNKPANAEKLYDKALQRDPTGLQTHLAVAQWALQTGKTGKLKEVSTAAAKIDPEAVQVMLLQGVIQRTEKNHAGAEATFRKALAQAPSNPIVLNQLALSLGEQDGAEKSKQAIEFSQMAVRMFPDTNQPFGREARVTLAWLAMKSGSSEQAMQMLKQALQVGPVGPEPAYYSALIFKESGQSDIAKKMLESALKNTEGVFPARKDAEALLKSLGGETSASTGQ